MTVTETIIARVRHLSVQDQQRVLELISTLPSSKSADAGAATNGDGERPERAFWSSLQRLGEASEKLPCDLPADFAANHDFYLHGLPKRS